jgi:hypothetical protein
MTDRVAYWRNRLDVMSRTQCVEITAAEAGELRGLLEAQEKARDMAFAGVVQGSREQRVMSWVADILGLRGCESVYDAARRVVKERDAALTELGLKRETEAERAGRLMVEAAQRR